MLDIEFSTDFWRKRGLEGRKSLSSTEIPKISEKEVITKTTVIVKIRCPFCHNLYDETLDKCPHCGAQG
jgi:rRNA maturation endonuclease Nob1